MLRFIPLCVALSACGAGELLVFEDPKQAGKVNPMKDRGEKSIEQRERDCWEMPNAQACYDVGMSYEMGLAVEADPQKALEFYDEACELEKQKEHCEAAERMRGEP